MIVSFIDRGTKDVFDGLDTHDALRACPEPLRKLAARRMDLLNVASTADDLAGLPESRVEELGGDLAGHHAMHLGDGYRVCFRWSDAGPESVQIVPSN
jgi:proteic killer suppression protein